MPSCVTLYCVADCQLHKRQKDQSRLTYKSNKIFFPGEKFEWEFASERDGEGKGNPGHPSGRKDFLDICNSAPSPGGAVCATLTFRPRESYHLPQRVAPSFLSHSLNLSLAPTCTHRMAGPPRRINK